MKRIIITCIVALLCNVSLGQTNTYQEHLSQIKKLSSLLEQKEKAFEDVKAKWRKHDNFHREAPNVSQETVQNVIKSRRKGKNNPYMIDRYGKKWETVRYFKAALVQNIKYEKDKKQIRQQYNNLRNEIKGIEQRIRDSKKDMNLKIANVEHQKRLKYKLNFITDEMYKTEKKVKEQLEREKEIERGSNYTLTDREISVRLSYKTAKERLIAYEKARADGKRMFIPMFGRHFGSNPSNVVAQYAATIAKYDIAWCIKNKKRGSQKHIDSLKAIKKYEQLLADFNAETQRMKEKGQKKQKAEQQKREEDRRIAMEQMRDKIERERNK